MRPSSCPPKTPHIAVQAPSQALLWKNSLTDVTSTLSVNPVVVGLRMILNTDEKPLQFGIYYYLCGFKVSSKKYLSNAADYFFLQFLYMYLTAVKYTKDKGWVNSPKS